jgi:serine phosphatase RsbU (regulator of sigma subunit)
VRFKEKLTELFTIYDTAKEIRDTLLEDVFAFFGEDEQEDDITLVVVKID